SSPRRPAYCALPTAAPWPVHCKKGAPPPPSSWRRYARNSGAKSRGSIDPASVLYSDRLASLCLLIGGQPLAACPLACRLGRNGRLPRYFGILVGFNFAPRMLSP